MRRSSARSLPFAIVLLLAFLPACGGSGPTRDSPDNQAPVFTTSLPVDPVFEGWQDLDIWVEANDPEGDPVDIVLLNPPVGSEFVPLRGASSPGRTDLHWHTAPQGGGLHELYFHVADDQGNAAIHQVKIEIRGAYYDRTHIVDVTGDGLLDVVVSAVSADVDGVVNTGAAYVWAGATSLSAAPTATLTVPGASQDDGVGGTPSSFTLFACRDVTGDGIADVVAGAPLADGGGIADQGAVYVWAGGPTLQGQVAPIARCTGTGTDAAGALGVVPTGVPMMLWEVTGDGHTDIVVRAPNAVAGGVVGAGAIYVWRGGPTLVGTQQPWATLADPGATADDALGQYDLFLTDVTGDTTPELISHSPVVDIGGTQDVGAVHVFATGAALVGNVSPLATLSVHTGAHAEDRIGSGAPILLADVNQDQIPDVIAVSPTADVGGMTNAGEAYVWAGTPGLSGDVDPTARLRVPGALAYDSLGSGGPGLRVADVTGDLILDIVVPTGTASIPDVTGLPVVDAGAIYIWAGQTGLSGTPAPTASLTVSGASPNDHLGMSNYCWDVTGDGILDVVATSFMADVGGVEDAGETYIWAGGAGLVGTPPPTARLTVNGASKNDRNGAWMHPRDVTGDAVPDLIIGSNIADVAGAVDAGAFHVWAGGTGLAGTPPSLATLRRPAPVAYDQLGSGGAHPVRVADVTGDGLNDIILKAEQADVGGVVDAGGVWIWSGGAALTGTPAPWATLTDPGATAGDALGGAVLWFNTTMLCVDVTDDGVLDLVVGSRLADVAGTADAGAIRIWAGGTGLAGSPAAYAALTVPGATTGDQLGSAFGNALHACDLTGNGRLDIVAVSSRATIGGVSQTGAAYVWSGGSELAGTPDPASILAVPGAVANDALGGWYGSQPP